MSNYLEQVEKLQGVATAANGVNPEHAVRMRLQNQFKTGLDVARYTADIMRRDIDNYESDTSQYTQSLGCWHGFIGQQKMIAIKKHFGDTNRRYLYLSGWMIAALRSEFGPLPDQSMHEKTSVPALIEELYTFLRQADAREKPDAFPDVVVRKGFKILVTVLRPCSSCRCGLAKSWGNRVCKMSESGLHTQMSFSLTRRS